LTPQSLSKSTSLCGGHRCFSCLKKQNTERAKESFSFIIPSLTNFVFSNKNKKGIL